MKTSKTINVQLQCTGCFKFLTIDQLGNGSMQKRIKKNFHGPFSVLFETFSYLVHVEIWFTVMEVKLGKALIRKSEALLKLLKMIKCKM